MGENPKGNFLMYSSECCKNRLVWLVKGKENVEAKALRAQKQAFGAKVYAIYCWIFVILMTLSCFNMLPGKFINFCGDLL